MRTGAALPLLPLAALAGCAAGSGSSPHPATLPPGMWGGDQVALTVSEDGPSRIELSCGSAEFEAPVKLDIGGHFLTEGRYSRGTGVATLQPPQGIPANISGRLDRDGLLWLDVATRDSYPVRSARLKRGAAPNLLRCLKS